jgi:hypothetical protein
MIMKPEASHCTKCASVACSLITCLNAMCCRYRTEDNDQWFKLSSVSGHEAVVEDMTPGEKYRIQVNTVSYGVESNQPQEVTQTVSEYCALCNNK